MGNDGVDFDRTRRSTTVVRERTQPGVPLFHLIESSNNTEGTTFCCLPVGWENTDLPNMEGEEEPSGFPPVSALELSHSASSKVTDVTVRRLPSFCLSSALLLQKAQQSDLKLLWLSPHPWENAQGMWTAPRQPTGNWTRKCRVTVHPGASTQSFSPPHAFSVGPLANAQYWTFQNAWEVSC